MKIPAIKNISNKILTNKYVLSGLEKISEHGTSFSAGVSLLMALGVRPLAISLTPKTDKENKQYAISNSICSGLTKFAIVEAVALPVENAVKRIDKNPEKYLNLKTIKDLSKGVTNLNNSKSYRLITQTLKLGTGFLTAIPKSMITIALIPIIMDKMFFRKSAKETPFATASANPSFNGRVGEQISKGLGKIINHEKIKNFGTKFQNKDKDIAKHITAATDILLTSAFAVQTQKSKDIKQNRKRALILNNVIATAITLAGGYAIDHVMQNKNAKFIEKFKTLNSGNIKVPKYIEGLNILRPALIFASIYYLALPIVSTFTSDKIDKYLTKKELNKTLK